MKRDLSASSLGFPEADHPERLGPPAVLAAAQREVAEELINGPRRGVYGPFRPLLHCPSLLRSTAKLGETLRYEGALDPTLREWTICAVARETSNLFEWDMHLPLAAAAGVPAPALAEMAVGEAASRDLRDDLAIAWTMTREVIGQHRLTDATYSAAVDRWDEKTVVELLTLIGYFAMVCWLMNVARTPGPAASCAAR
ncbi:carboxymuconolactone decarboxylase family protein [Teichococcus vastitatis]|uniref:Carboxymuconolactone decarboxylase family protein n=1 Tax=Teichococcus vastitatis TaxID=2307076 RepID=A0ABS9W995_9PROT|nr:carboxymuconolactone decarboxylase family protein [Pseudoroseomonas vastitatis]MCI0755788.1 carboxymuconolactone decarboxylase family protein [Pseudoroseomonas vastitatis]